MGKNNIIEKAIALHEELVGVVQGGWIGTLAGDSFLLKGQRDMIDGKLALNVIGHSDLIDPQWRDWVIGALLRSGTLLDVAEKIWTAGITLYDLSSYGSVGRAIKPYMTGTVMFIDELWLQVENLCLTPDVAIGFQKKVADKTFTTLDLLQMLRNAQSIAGKGIAQTGGDVLYKQHNVVGYSSR